MAAARGARSTASSHAAASPSSSRGSSRRQHHHRRARGGDGVLFSSTPRFANGAEPRRQHAGRQSCPRRRRGPPEALPPEALDLNLSLPSLGQVEAGAAALPLAGLAVLTFTGAFKKSKNLSDIFARLLTIVSQGYFQPNVGGDTIPEAEGEASDLVGDEPLFKALYNMFLDSGGVFRLSFGPKCFLVVSDPVVVRHILKDNAFNFDKGVLAEILKPIMGKGLIPADIETWKVRRKAVIPGFHKAYLDCMVDLFGRCTERTVEKIDRVCKGDGDKTLDMETEFLNVALDIIGLGIFNYDFGSVNTESPVIKSVYGVLKEAEHRSTTYIPYWNLPFADVVVPRQRQFKADITIINDVLDDLIKLAQETQQEEDMEALQNRDYKNVKDPSLLRFLVDMRGEDSSAKQLRDDLMTMLIAGHETTGAVLTWALHCLVENPEELEKTVSEIDRVLGDRTPTFEDIREMKQVRMVIAESLRLYPQPPILIRRALAKDTLPGGIGGDPNGYEIGKGTDLFISVWNLHRSPHIWKDPDAFKPGRFDEAIPAQGPWEGYDGKNFAGLYPNESAYNFAYVPFGGGPRKCLGDQFALMEAVIALAMMLRRFNFKVKEGHVPGMATGATIHTAKGLLMDISRRDTSPSESEELEEMVAK
ncbi:cytochrome P450 [Chloropicon primus]|uniref:Cytochrome P450 n=2 Tax=Chloropicon primus TaxID=1764295 RepID=A0A5B8MF65_9CHLO|nr:cytochrome P450 [Chloropicon primus]UPQ98312.1 cytochrome P450 [Chloropicon primus]|eukprot:QDZ19103.1 cytochrome P450 [Chloropicon primus]